MMVAGTNGSEGVIEVKKAAGAWNKAGKGSFLPCPKCGMEDIDWGIESENGEQSVFAECPRCGCSHKLYVHDDEWHSMTLSYTESLAKKLWNKCTEQDKRQRQKRRLRVYKKMAQRFKEARNDRL